MNGLEHGYHVRVSEAQDTGVVDKDKDVAGLELTVHPGWPVGHHRLDLEELVHIVVPTDDGEAQASGRLD